jgi:hypothetical protein
MPNLNPAPAKPHTAGILSALVTIVGFVAMQLADDRAVRPAEGRGRRVLMRHRHRERAGSSRRAFSTATPISFPRPTN